MYSFLLPPSSHFLPIAISVLLLLRFHTALGPSGLSAQLAFLHYSLPPHAHGVLLGHLGPLALTQRIDVPRAARFVFDALSCQRDTARASRPTRSETMYRRPASGPVSQYGPHRNAGAAAASGISACCSETTDRVPASGMALCAGFVSTLLSLRSGISAPLSHARASPSCSDTIYCVPMSGASGACMFHLCSEPSLIDVSSQFFS
ncbi:hypothetical protein B0H15DRAFT_866963 [Mycena belliarum]|uniref:Secreted protein n=1 Tax=Mycena belliarum TaxID=1033014 RepID=A0AAD6XF57_9AGAR|nr:hypothetical protein B0H15DRAFT_866963 [Mycena belliae]